MNAVTKYVYELGEWKRRPYFIYFERQRTFFQFIIDNYTELTFSAISFGSVLSVFRAVCVVLQHPVLGQIKTYIN